LICPKETFKCVVTSEAISGDENRMKTVAECFDRNEKVLEKKEYQEPNPLPNNKPPFR
jgi:uridine phosphorylase